MHRALALEELGLLHLLERLDRGTHSVDGIVLHGLLKDGLVLVGNTIELTEKGLLTVQALRAARRQRMTGEHVRLDQAANSAES